MMAKIFTYPGFQHLAEKVFMNLDVEDLKMCAQINQSCKQILKNSMFWLKKFGLLSKESQEEWIKIIHSVKNSEFETIIVSYLQWTLTKKFEEVDLPWFRKFRRRRRGNQNNWIKFIESEKNSGTETAIMSYLQWNLRKEALDDLPCYTSAAVQEDFRKKIYEICTQMVRLLSTEDIEIVKSLVLLIDNPNAPNNYGETPIYCAACNG